MFGRLKQLLDNATTLDPNKVMQRAFDDQTLQAQVIDLNTYGQLYDKGINSEGQSLGDYSLATLYGTKNFAGKIEKGARHDHITLSDTFEFYRSFRFDHDYEGFTITADSIKDGQDLEKTFGKVVGLTRESRQEIIPHLRENMREETRKILAGKDV